MIGWWNLHHHARFYDEYPHVSPLALCKSRRTRHRSGATGGGLGALSLFAPRRLPPSVWATLLVLVLTNLTGRNMGEVARLWMLYTPPLLICAAADSNARLKTRHTGGVNGTGRAADTRTSIHDPGGLSRLVPVCPGFQISLVSYA